MKSTLKPYQTIQLLRKYHDLGQFHLHHFPRTIACGKLVGLGVRGDIPGVGDSRGVGDTPGVEQGVVPVVREGQRVDMLLRGRSSSPGGVVARGNGSERHWGGAPKIMCTIIRLSILCIVSIVCTYLSSSNPMNLR